jgi:hypothetical protein
VLPTPYLGRLGLQERLGHAEVQRAPTAAPITRTAAQAEAAAAAGRSHPRDEYEVLFLVVQHVVDHGVFDAQ